MFRVILMTQWKWARLIVLGAVVVAFAVPIMSVQPLSREVTSWVDGRAVLGAMRAFSTVYALLAAAIGLALGVSAWAADHRGRHVYALSLPLPRWRFALLRFGAGSLLLVLPVIALWIGAVLSVASVEIPPGLEAFPTSLTIRFALATGVAFATFFAIAAGTPRTAGWVLGGLGAVIAMMVFGSAWGLPDSVIHALEGVLFYWPGHLEIFTGRWMLIDV